MQTLNKTEQIAHLQGKSGPDRNMAVQDMLMAYRDTPHPATGISPYQAMTNRPVRTKLDYTVPRKERSSRDKMMDEKDRQYKEKTADEVEAVKNTILLWEICPAKTKKEEQMVNPI